MKLKYNHYRVTVRGEAGNGMTVQFALPEPLYLPEGAYGEDALGWEGLAVSYVAGCFERIPALGRITEVDIEHLGTSRTAKSYYYPKVKEDSHDVLR